MVSVWRRQFFAGALALFALIILLPPAAEAHPETPSRQQNQAEVMAAQSLTDELREKARARSAQPGDSRRAQQAAKQRAAKLRELAETNPTAVAALALSPAERKALPKGARKHVEQHVDLSGELRVMHVDHEDGHSEYVVNLAEKDGRESEVRLGAPLGRAKPGDRVEVSALSIPGASAPVVTEVQVASPSTPQPIGPQRTAVILASAPSAAVHPYANTAHAASLIFPSLNSGSARSYFAQASYGLTTIVGGSGAEGTSADVYGPYTLSHTGCDYVTIRNQAIAAADVHINYNSYDRALIVWNRSGCGNGGVANVRAFTIGTFDSASQRLGTALVFNTGFGPTTGANPRVGAVTLHEYGHSLGVWHANALECGAGVSIGGGSCSSDEYGDPADVMGSGNHGHFNAAHKDMLGWFTGTRLQTVTSSGVYILNGYENGADNLKAIRIPRTRDASNTPTSYYYFEFRQPSPPFDGYAQSGTASSYDTGVLVHTSGYVPPCVSGCGPDFTGPGGGGDTHLIDVHPNTPSNFSDAPIFLGQTYSDSAAGVSVQVLAVAGGLATINVTIGAPSRSIESVVYPAGAGSVTGGGVVPDGQAVTLRAVPSSGWAFSTWRENRANIGGANPLNFNATRDRSLEAVFVASACPSSPRPPVNVSTQPIAGGMLATITSSVNIQSIEFTATDNALVTIAGVPDRSGAFTVPFAAGTTSTTFTFRRPPPQSGAATVHFQVNDPCGAWPSFVGAGGPSW